MRLIKITIIVVVGGLLLTTCVPLATAQAGRLPRGCYPVQLPLGAGAAADVWVTSDYMVSVEYDELVIRYTYTPYMFARLYSLRGRYIVYLYLPISRRGL